MSIMITNASPSPGALAKINVCVYYSLGISTGFDGIIIIGSVTDGHSVTTGYSASLSHIPFCCIYQEQYCRRKPDLYNSFCIQCVAYSSSNDVSAL